MPAVPSSSVEAKVRRAIKEVCFAIGTETDCKLSGLS